MSRIGKKPIALPSKVTVNIDDHKVSVKGPKGELAFEIHPEMSVSQENGELLVNRPSDARQHKALHGLTRALLANMITGVSTGFRKSLQIEGVGYTSDLRGKDLVLKLGYSHEIVVNPPPNVSF